MTKLIQCFVELIMSLVTHAVFISYY